MVVATHDMRLVKGIAAPRLHLVDGTLDTGEADRQETLSGLPADMPLPEAAMLEGMAGPAGS